MARAEMQTCITRSHTRSTSAPIPVLTGTGTSGAKPVFVVVFAEANMRLVYVLSAADCSVVTRTTLP